MAKKKVARPKRALVERTAFERLDADFYIEDQWVSEALFRAEDFTGRVVDPAAGRGHIIGAAIRAGIRSEGWDIAIRPGADLRRDFLKHNRLVDNIVSNPPFSLCQPPDYQFITHALDVTRNKVALFLPVGYLTSQRRQNFLKTTPLYRVYFLAPRPGIEPGKGYAKGDKKGSGLTNFVWLVWLKGFTGNWTGHFLQRRGQDGAATTTQP